MSHIEHLSWDSQFFGKRIGKLDIFPANADALITLMQSAKEQYDCLYAQSAISDFQANRLAVRTGFVPADIKVTLQARSSKEEKPAMPETGCDVSTYNPESDSVSALEDIAEHASIYSRFNNDPFFRPRVKDFFRLWVRNSCVSGFADLVLIAKEEGDPAGVLTAKTVNNEVQISLVAVKPEFQGKGLGSALINSLFAKFPGSDLSVVTQANNYPALGLYSKKGFRIASSSVFYHNWLSE